MNLRIAADPRRAEAYRLPWAAGVVGMLAVVALGMLGEVAGWIGPTRLGEATLSMHVSAAASGLLAIAAALYLVLDDAGIERLGDWASRLALAGGMGLVAGSILRAAETSIALTDAFEFRLALEAPALIAASAVLVYLRIEQAWCERRAGALVLGLAVITLGLDLWLMATAQGVPAVVGKVMDEHLLGLWHLGGKLGVLASVALAAWSVLRRRIQASEPKMVDRVLRAGMSLGFSGFTLALASAMALTLMPGPTPESLARCAAGLAVWLCFSLLYLVWRRVDLASPRLATWILCTLVPAGAAYQALTG